MPMGFVGICKGLCDMALKIPMWFVGICKGLCERTKGFFDEYAPSRVQRALSERALRKKDLK